MLAGARPYYAFRMRVDKNIFIFCILISFFSVNITSSESALLRRISTIKALSADIIEWNIEEFGTLKYQTIKV